MPNTPRMGWPFPDRNVDPWFDAIQDFFNQLDSSGFAAREDRHILVTKGGTFSFDATSGDLTWTDTIELTAAITGFLWRVAATTINLAEGDVFYLNLARSPTNNTTLLAQTAQQVPSSDEALLLGIRKDNRVYLRGGKILNDGDSIAIYQVSSGGGGGGGDLATTLGLGNVTGGTDLLVTGGDRIASVVGAALTVEAQGPASGAGTNLLINAGDAAVTDDPGGDIILTAGDAAGTGAGGGDISGTGGAGADEVGGNVGWTGGAGGIGFDGGQVALLGGSPAGGNADGGGVLLDGGAGAGTGAQGEVQVANSDLRLEQVARLEETSQPTTAVNEGAIWVDDGVSQTAGTLYFRAESDGAVTNLLAGGGGFGQVQEQLAGAGVVDGVTSVTFVAQFPFDTTEWTGATTFTFGGILSASSGALTATLELYNLTDAELVTGTTLTTSAVAPTLVESAALTVGSAAGNLQDTPKVYEVRISTTGTLNSEFTFLGSAFMRIV